MSESFSIPPEPYLVGDSSRETPARLRRAAALMVAGIALPIASTVLAADGLHLRLRTQSLPWAIVLAATVLGLGCDVGAIALWVRARKSVPAWGETAAMGLAALVTLSLLLFAAVGAWRLTTLTAQGR